MATPPETERKFIMEAFTLIALFVSLIGYALVVLFSQSSAQPPNKLPPGENLHNINQIAAAAARRGYSSMDAYQADKRANLHNRQRITEPAPRAIQPPKPAPAATRSVHVDVEDLIGSTVKIEYTSEDGEITERIITVSDFYEHSNKIRAWCHLRNDVRHFFCQHMNVTSVINATPQLAKAIG